MKQKILNILKGLFVFWMFGTVFGFLIGEIQVQAYTLAEYVGRLFGQLFAVSLCLYLGTLCLRSMLENEKIVFDENGNEVRNGLGGCLILVGFGVVFTPVRILYGLVTHHWPMFYDGSYEIVTTPGTEFYHPFWSTFLWGEITINALFFFASLFLVFLFFTERKSFPKFFIWFLVSYLAFMIIDAMLIKVVAPNEVIFDAGILEAIGKVILVVLIFVPYMLISKRVRVTFVN